MLGRNNSKISKIETRHNNNKMNFVLASSICTVQKVQKISTFEQTHAQIDNGISIMGY